MAARKKSKRSISALKGWQTRRKNVRSSIALKGWKTRRKNEKLKKREITPGPRKRKEEYVLRFSYTTKPKKRQKNAVSVKVEIHVKGSARAKREIVIRAARTVFGTSLKGWTAEVIAWQKEYLNTGHKITYRDREDFNNELVRRAVGQGDARFRDRSDSEL